MSGPSDDDVRRSQKHAQQAAKTAETFAPYVEANKLNPQLLKQVLDKFVTNADDPSEDGVYVQRWMDVATFCRFTEEYVAPEKRAAYKAELERAFPPKRGAL